MDPYFWLQKWQIKDIAFHQAEANPLLVKCFKELSLVQGSRVFLPLCGKTLDIAWLLSNGYRVAETELRAQERITCCSRISFSVHLRPLFTRSILAVAQATPAVLLGQIDQI